MPAKAWLPTLLTRAREGSNALAVSIRAARWEPERAGYLAMAGVDLAAVLSGSTRLERLTKPALLPLLAGTVSRAEVSKNQRVVALAGLAGGWAGDVILLCRDHRALPAGAAAFAVNQLAYCWLLHNQGARPAISRVAVRAVPWGLGVAVAASRAPKLLPVVAGYGGLLAATSMLAGDRELLDHSAPATQGLGHGANLFLISDALILVRTVLVTPGSPTERLVGAGVMSTYLIAQLLLVDGLLRR